MIKKKCHFIGIGGIGMSGLARILRKRNIEVSGSDIAQSYVTDALQNDGIKVSIGHSAQHIIPNTTVVYTTGISEKNPEYAAAENLKCTLIHRADLLTHLTSGYKTIAIAGTHGKTTTSGLLTAVLKEAGKDPSFAVGGVITQFGTNADDGTGDYFVIEACENDGTFLRYNSFGSIITNIDLDHMDYYLTEDALITAFETFADKVISKDLCLWCGDDKYLKAMSPQGISYGFDADCDLKISNFQQRGWHIFFDVEFKGKVYPKIELALIGQHNALNGAAVFGLALNLNIPESVIRKAFLSFKGMGRRLETKGEANGVLFLDDYGHHPTEIKTTLKGIRTAIGERRLIVIYQPHRYTRTRDCLGMYQQAFDAADEVILTTIYGSGESPIPGIDEAKVFEDISQATSASVKHVDQDFLVDHLALQLRPHDVVLSLGAGNINGLAEEVIDRIQKQPLVKYKVGLIFGGVSVEHQVSLMSAQNIETSLKNEFYQIEYFAISRQGKWVTGEAAYNYLKQGKDPFSNMVNHQLIGKDVMEALLDCDLFFPVLHGPFGEDGTIQGFFEILGKPYVGCGHLAAAICMDKTITKQLMALHGIPTVESLSFSRYEWEQNRDQLLHNMQQNLGFPMFIKPVHLGSSLGVSKVEKFEDLKIAIETAFKIDTHIIAEKGLVIREIEFAVLGNDVIEVFPPGEILTNGKVYDYDCKYGPNAMKADTNPKLSSQAIEEGKEIVKKAYSALGCSGMARIDTFLDQDGKFWLNEINPIPGFTKNSLFPMLCSVNGLACPDLMDHLIILGLQRKRMHRMK